MSDLPEGFTQLEFAFEGLTVRGLQGGEGATVLLLHGSGPGASALGNWRSILPALRREFRVVAIDLIGFGRSDRRPQSPLFDMSMWQRQVAAALDWIGLPGVQVLAHSIAAPLTLHVAAADARIVRIVTTGAMGAAFPVSDALHRIWRCPRTPEQLRAAGRALVADASHIDERWVEQRSTVVGAPGYADYFDAMFDGPLERFIDASTLDAATLSAARVPVLLVHGRHDLAFPWEPLSGALARRLPQADLVLLNRCGHSVALERGPTLLGLCRSHFLH